MQIEALLDERQTTHGDFADHANMTHFLKDAMRSGKNWGRLTRSQREALDMVAHKIGRILAGNPNHSDHWDDIAGYAKLVSRQIAAAAATPEVLPVQGVPVEMPDSVSAKRAPHPSDATVYKSPIGPKPNKGFEKVDLAAIEREVEEELRRPAAK